MVYTYQFEDHLRQHRPSRLGERLWWLPVAAAVLAVLADGVYLVVTASGQVSDALALALPLLAALLLIVAWGALGIAEWTYPAEKQYRETQHAVDDQARAYILAGRRSRGESPPPGAQNGTEGPAEEAIRAPRAE